MDRRSRIKNERATSKAKVDRSRSGLHTSHSIMPKDQQNFSSIVAGGLTDSEWINLLGSSLPYEVCSELTHDIINKSLEKVKLKEIQINMMKHTVNATLETIDFFKKLTELSIEKNNEFEFAYTQDEECSPIISDNWAIGSMPTYLIEPEKSTYPTDTSRLSLISAPFEIPVISLFPLEYHSATRSTLHTIRTESHSKGQRQSFEKPRISEVSDHETIIGIDVISKASRLSKRAFRSVKQKSLSETKTIKTKANVHSLHSYQHNVIPKIASNQKPSKPVVRAKITSVKKRIVVRPPPTSYHVLQNSSDYFSQRMNPGSLKPEKNDYENFSLPKPFYPDPQKDLVDNKYMRIGSLGEAKRITLPPL
ncbi:hypothetical protein SNEBB_009613 [Seison nebaliae]|nr:hypothetical protein SNEBB_009613 [Seison nebaliae]